MEQDRLIDVIAQCYSQLRTKAFYILRHHQDAEDALQNACLKAWLHRDSVRSDTNCLAWLNRIVYNECMEVFRGHDRQPCFITAESLSSIQCLQDNLDIRIEKWSLDEVIRTLPTYQWYPLYLHYYWGYDIASVAEQLNLAVGTVKSRIFNARRQLKRKLENM